MTLIGQRNTLERCARTMTLAAQATSTPATRPNLIEPPPPSTRPGLQTGFCGHGLQNFEASCCCSFRTAGQGRTNSHDNQDSLSLGSLGLVRDATCLTRESIRHEWQPAMEEINARSQTTGFRLLRVVFHLAQTRTPSLPGDVVGQRKSSCLDSGLPARTYEHAPQCFRMGFATPLEEINARRAAPHTQESEGRESAIQR